jgi:hypothetical protein
VKTRQTTVAQVSQPAVSPISKSAGWRNCVAFAGLEAHAMNPLFIRAGLWLYI